MGVSHRAMFIGLGVAVSLVGCALVASLGTDDPAGPAFPHLLHGEDEGLTCTACHRGAAKAAEAGMPKLAQCQLCHEEIDEEKSPAQRAAAFFEADRRRVTRLPDEVKFSHVAHAAKARCADCHPGIATSKRVEPKVRVEKDACLSCHTAAGGVLAEKRCATCHTAVGKDVAPASHRLSWERMHGQVVRAGSERIADRCGMCHTETSCELCHRNTPPRDHTEFWRLRGHGLTAAMDRQACATCHLTDTCLHCHQTARPQDHTAGWGSPGDRHCLGCHVTPTSRTEGCGVCHLGTPSHASAPRQPPNHRPGMRCRQCHGAQQPLPHFDTGVPCNACHR